MRYLSSRGPDCSTIKESQVTDPVDPKIAALGRITAALNDYIGFLPVSARGPVQASLQADIKTLEPDVKPAE